MNLVHDGRLSEIWEDRHSKVKGRGVTFVSFQSERRHKHVIPHFKSTPLGKTRFIDRETHTEPTESLVEKFLVAADAIIMKTFLTERDWRKMALINLDLSIDTFSQQLTGLRSMLDSDDPFFMGDKSSKRFNYPVLYPHGGGFKVDIHTYCVAAQTDIPLTEQVRLSGKYKQDREWGLDPENIDTVTEIDYLHALTVFPSTQRNTNAPEQKPAYIRLITPEEAIQLQDMGRQLIEMENYFKNCGIPEYAKRISKWCQTVQQGNETIDRNLG